MTAIGLSIAAPPSRSAAAHADEAGEPFTFERVQSLAESLAVAPYASPARVAEPYLNLDYDIFRMVAPRRERALWRDADFPFEIDFLPAGFLFQHPIEINVIDSDGHVRNIPADSSWFEYRRDAAALEAKSGAAFSGFQLFGLLPSQREKTEIAVFQGASYFRAVAANLNYGASARGLAIDIGLSAPEEFPRFAKYWLEQPAPDAKHARIWALLDSPAVAGAYQFTIEPGAATTLDVEAHLWFRHGVQKVGVAPLTSMWMWDGAATKLGDDPRPEVHDSDTLWIDADDQPPTMRPLTRPGTPGVSSWQVKKLRAFGLLQRDRDYDHYKDDEAKYDRRPSVWITPAEDWGPGHVELLELPSNHEGGDNIGAYWVSEKTAAAHDHWTPKYRVTFGDEPEGVQ